MSENRKNQREDQVLKDAVYSQELRSFVVEKNLEGLVLLICEIIKKTVPELNSSLAKTILKKMVNGEECRDSINEFIFGLYSDLPKSSIHVRNLITTDLESHFFRSVIFFCEGLIEEHGLREKEDGWIEERIIQFSSLITFLEKEQKKVGKENLHQKAFQEIQRNKEILEAVNCIAQLPFEAKRFHFMVSILWKMITSNLVVISDDLNFRTILNGQKGVSHSLFIPHLKQLDWYANPITAEYVPFIEATASSQIKIGQNPEQLSSTFGFLHLLALDEKGIAHIQEYPHIMFSRESQNFPQRTRQEMADFEKKFRRNHDLFHHLIQVYAKHFAIHHLHAPITLAGYLPSYLDFAEGMRAEKEAYELLISNLHAEILGELPKENTSVDFDVLEKVLKVLKEMKKKKGALVKDFVDYHVVLFTTRALNVFPVTDNRYEKIKKHIEEIGLEKVFVSKKMIIELLETQGIRIENAEDEERLNRKEINHWVKKEIGVDGLIEALIELNLIPLNEVTELHDFDICRWAVLTMPQKKEQKGFAEKALRTTKYPHREKFLSSREHLALNMESIMNDLEEYQKRVLFGEALEKILFELFKFISSIKKLKKYGINQEQASQLDAFFYHLYSLEFNDASKLIQSIKIIDQKVNKLLVFIGDFLKIPYVKEGRFKEEIQKIKNRHMRLG